MENIIDDSILILLDYIAHDDELLDMVCLLTPTYAMNIMLKNIKE